MFRNPVTDAIVAIIILLLVFGPKRLPALARSLGLGIREFKDSITSGPSEDGERSIEAATHTAPEARPPSRASSDSV